jgi:hypothetical protein
MPIAAVITCTPCCCSQDAAVPNSIEVPAQAMNSCASGAMACTTSATDVPCCTVAGGSAWQLP